MPAPRQPMMLLGEGKVWVTQSSSDMKKTHTTVLAPNGVAHCTCTGWRVHHKCWHVAEVLETDEEEIEWQINL